MSIIIVTWSLKLQGHIARKNDVSHVECLGPKERLTSSNFRRRRNTGSNVADHTSSSRLLPYQ